MPETPALTGQDANGRAGGLVLVVGCGFIGSHVATELAARSRRFAVLTRSRPVEEIAVAIEPSHLRIGDAADPRALDAALDGVAHVVYTAGGRLPAAAEEDPELSARLTLDPLRAVLSALGERPGVGLTYLSSGGTIYGEPEVVPVPEEAPTRPLGSYGRLHLECEEEILRQHREQGLQARILRCSTVYGEHQQPDRGQGAVVTFLHRVAHGKQIELYGSGATVRDYVYAGDVAKVVVELLDRRDGPEVLNVGSGRGTTLAELLEIVEAELGRRAQVTSRADRGFEVDRIVLDTGKLRQLTSFEPLALEAGVERTHSWLARAAALPA